MSKIPAPQSPGHDRDRISTVSMEIELGEFTFFVPSTWSADHAVIQFEVFTDGVLMRLEQADTSEAYRLAAVVKESLPAMIRELRRMLHNIQATPKQKSK